MTIIATKTVKDLVVEMPGATRVLEKLGIDYCCGGGLALEDACAKAGITIDELSDTLKNTVRAAEPGQTDWLAEPLGNLVKHILEKHHTYTRDEMDRLSALLAKVCSVHGQNHPELGQIQQAFSSLCGELTPHMFKEEQILFPYIVRLEEAVSAGRVAPFSPFGTVQNPVRMMMSEHDNAGELLREIRELSQDFKTPPDGCASFRALYEGLEAFEQDLHQHIHLENNLLFPRAIEMERNSPVL